ncbi:MAG: hypothetical protein HQ567_00430 [Candidatus Nealsonbacteria bacterium]|nr:hypothetical protein [Candidatus Nealsonbacteria bacterium]
MSSNPEVCSSVDAVRCLYLARVAERAGHHWAAQRWHAKASAWLDRNLPSSQNVRPSHTQAGDRQDTDERTMK